MYACMYVCMCIYIYIYTHIDTYTHTNTRIHVHIHMRVPASAIQTRAAPPAGPCAPPPGRKILIMLMLNLRMLNLFLNNANTTSNINHANAKSIFI